MLSDEQWEFLQDVAKLIEYAKDMGYKLTGGELYRTRYQQKEYMRTGRSKTMRSYHLKRLAIDLNVFVGGDLTWDYNDIEPLGIFWESLSPKNRWGGHFRNFKDLPHFERRA